MRNNPTSSWVISKKFLATTRCVITQRVVAILPLPEERSFQLLRGGTLKSRKFLLAIRTGHEILHARTVGDTETHYHNLNTNIKNQVY